MKKHEMGNLPSSGGRVLDKAGVDNTGYIDKKGTASGINAGFNELPPGQNIEDQCCADIRDIPMKNPTVMGYEGDDWGSEGGMRRKSVTKREYTHVGLPLAGGDSEKEGY